MCKNISGDIYDENSDPDESKQVLDYDFYRYNITASDNLPLNFTPKDYRSKECANTKYDTKNLPSASVIIVFFNEGLSVVLRTVYTVLNTVPGSLLKEVLLVDDGSDVGKVSDAF